MVVDEKRNKLNIKDVDNTSVNTDRRLDIALQCSAVLSGVKPANLLILKQELTETEKEELSKAKLKISLLYLDKSGVVYYVYSEPLTAIVLKDLRTRYFFKKQGYIIDSCENPLPYIIEKIEKKYRAYHEGVGDFPHELGVLLGYPTPDVEAFMLCRGKHYKLVGYWKVYQKVEQAKKRFYSFDVAKVIAKRAVSKGASFGDLRATFRSEYRNIYEGEKKWIRFM